MKKQSVAFAISIAIHISIFILIAVYSDSEDKQDFEEISIVALSPFKPDVLNAKKSSKKVNSKQKKENLETGVVGLQDKSSVEGVTTEKNIGNSDVEATLQGRAPENESERYLSELRNQIAEQQTYPLPSKALGEEGSVKVRLTLRRDGALIKIEVFDPSPFARLNDAAIKAASRAAPFKPFPSEVSFELWQITLPIRFTLSKS